MKAWRTILIGGAASFIAYAIVVYAFSQASIALVTALRETSIIFAMLIGVLALGEKMSIIRVLSAMMALGGAVILKLSKG
jgi:drug/metabolite transporter (DMT)-like permease